MERWNGKLHDKRRFHKDGARILRRLARHLGLKTGECSISHNTGGSAVGGEISLHSSNLYLWIAGSCGGDFCFVIGRKCHGRKDYGTGPDCPNKSFDWTLLSDPKALAESVLSTGLVP